MKNPEREANKGREKPKPRKIYSKKQRKDYLTRVVAGL